MVILWQIYKTYESNLQKWSRAENQTKDELLMENEDWQYSRYANSVNYIIIYIRLQNTYNYIHSSKTYSTVTDWNNYQLSLQLYS